MSDPGQVAQQDKVLSAVVQRCLAGRKWFFRRRDLPHADTPDYNDTIIVLVKLAAGESEPAQAFAPLKAALQQAGHIVLETRHWDAKPGHGDRWDNDPAVNSEWLEFCCAVADTYVTTLDATAARRVAASWLGKRPPWGRRLVHWLCWITGDADERTRLAQFGVT